MTKPSLSSSLHNLPHVQKGLGDCSISQQSSCQNLPRLLCATHSFDVSKSSRSIKRQTFWFLTTQYWLTYGQLKKTGSEGTRSEKDTKQKYIWNWTRAGQPHQVCDHKATVSLLLYLCEAVVVIESGHSHTDEHHSGLSCEQRLLSSMAFSICEAVSPGLSIA